MSDEMNQKLTQAVNDGEPEEAEALAKEAKFIEEIVKRCTFVQFQYCAPFASLGSFSRGI